jgi:hypothetical protein
MQAARLSMLCTMAAPRGAAVQGGSFAFSTTSARLSLGKAVKSGSVWLQVIPCGRCRREKGSGALIQIHSGVGVSAQNRGGR